MLFAIRKFKKGFNVAYITSAVQWLIIYQANKYLETKLDVDKTNISYYVQNKLKWALCINEVQSNYLFHNELVYCAST